MTYRTIDPNYELSITIDYEDQAGHQWQRTDAGQPKRLDDHLAFDGTRAEESR